MATTRRRGVFSPAAASALALLFLLVCSSSHRPAHAARPLHPGSAAPLSRQVEIEVKEEAVAAEDGMVLQRVQEEAANNGVDKPVVVYEETVPAAADADQDQDEEAAACDAGEDENCMQRRLLHDAHLDYIYTQHKGKP